MSTQSAPELTEPDFDADAGAAGRPADAVAATRDISIPLWPAADGTVEISPAEARREEIGVFLRSRRERLAPEQVGLPHGGRRRTPGLRREEVAQLAGVGVTWYTWLEQGRDINASEQVLDAIARTLQLDASEREHLLTLGGVGPDPEVERQCYALSPGTRAVLEHLDPMPAVVVNAKYDILAYNRAYGTLILDLDSLPRQDRNTVWLLATNPEWRRALPDWEHGLEHCIAQLRGAMAEHLADPAWRAFVARLCEASPEVAAVWERHEVQRPENRTKEILREDVGLLRLDYTNFWLGPRSGARMITYSPADEASALKLQQLAGDRPALTPTADGDADAVAVA